MKTFYAAAHLAHDPGHEFEHGRLTPAVEVPARAERVRAEIEKRRMGPILAPAEYPDQAILAVHDQGLVGFLSHAHENWRRRYGDDAPNAIASA